MAQSVRSLDLTTHTSLSPIRHGFAPGFVNYKKGCTQLAAASDKVYQLLAHGRWFTGIFFFLSCPILIQTSTFTWIFIKVKTLVCMHVSYN